FGEHALVVCESEILHDLSIDKRVKAGAQDEKHRHREKDEKPKGSRQGQAQNLVAATATMKSDALPCESPGDGCRPGGHAVFTAIGTPRSIGQPILTLSPSWANSCAPLLVISTPSSRPFSVTTR